MNRQPYLTRLTGILSLALTLLLLTGGCALASEHGKDGRPLNLGAKGKRVTHKGQRYVWLKEVRAVNGGTQTADPALRLAEMGVDAASVVTSKQHLIVFKPRRKTAAAQAFVPEQDQSGKTTYPVVLNEESGNLGIVLGAIHVKLTNPDQATALARRHGLKVKRIYLRLGFAIFSAGPGQDPFAVAKTLVAEAGVESATVEVLEHLNVPQ